jgi:aldehyde dehydrogenase (NAD+)
MADHKGTVVIGNSSAHEDGNLIPTVILNPAEDCPLMTDETFGPILSIFTYKKIEEAIKTINSKPKPLGIYYFGSNSNKNESLNRLMKETSSGAFLVNEMVM